MLQEVFLACQRHKNTVNYSAVALGTHQKNSKNPPTSAQNDIQKASCNFIVRFFHPGPRKMRKHIQPEGF
jgi:hypothetical protein